VLIFATYHLNRWKGDEVQQDFGAFVLLSVIAVLAPILAAQLAHWVPVPLVVFEIVLGLLLGPQGFGLGKHGEFIDALSDLGLATLMFLAGYEIDFGRISGPPLRRATLGWLLGLGLSLAVAMLIADNASEGVYIGAAMATTALGTILPIVRDAELLDTPFGRTIMAVGSVGEFGPIVAVALFLSGRSPGRSAATLLVFAAVTALAIWRASHTRGTARMRSLVSKTLHSSGQFAVRMMICVLALMVYIAVELDLDMLLGAFTAGVIGRMLLSSTSPLLQQSVMSKLEAVGFGFLVPVFFINTGLDFDLDALTAHASTLALLPLFLMLFLLLRGGPVALLAEPRTSHTDRAVLGMFGATQLPMVVAITTIGTQAGRLDSGTAAALVGAGMLSVLLFPLIALRLRGEAAPAARPGARAESW
jgi:Kef-type K+ transport system membrane component KefB